MTMHLTIQASARLLKCIRRQLLHVAKEEPEMRSSEDVDVVEYTVLDQTAHVLLLEAMIPQS